MIPKKWIFCLLIICGYGSLLASSEKKADPHGKSETPKTPDEIQKEGRESLAITDHYVHSWLAFPTLSGVSPFSDEKSTLKAEKGYATVAYFVASWCLPCQKLFNDMQSIVKKYENLNTKFVFIFAHDTKEDVLGFAKEHGLTSRALIADHAVLKAFHNPKLPTVYVSDRRTWLNRRFVDVDSKGLNELSKMLALMTSY